MRLRPAADFSEVPRENRSVPMYRVLLADDEPIILSGLQSMLDWERLDCAVCAAARDGQQAQ